ncbi:RHS repeat domain-containing protein [Kibdelosporangium persicum]|uniref:RHS repeat domain-containing protein n=2 Tax=Kibdelosporangium persicum TaxID=2698649 RepID=UPI0015678DC4|nr:RHS repeat protein [Kibdelosporangium persicum]
MAVVSVVAALVVPAGVAVAGPPGAQRERSVPGGAVTPGKLPADPAANRAVRATPEVVWPKAAVNEVPVAARGAGDGPVRVSPAAAGRGTPGRVRVEVLDQAASRRAGVPGLMFRIARADGVRDEGPIGVEVDYSGFRHAFGGDYATRMRLVRIADCAGCAPVALQAGNDVKAGRIAAEVPVGQQGALFAVTAASSGSAGNFTATSLAPSATWSVGLQSGDFTWSYPMAMPPMPGLVPDVELRYSSGAVDGRTASTNNQASWVGEGFDYHPGFIERSFKPCAEDMAGGSNGVKSGDECWATFNGKLVQSVHVSLPGLASELVQDDVSPGKWRAEEDDGWRVELLTGAPNGDNDGEYWQLTSPDGTRYVFGRSQLPGGVQTNSASTMPVYGNHANEPCRGATFDSSWCQQAYRWNLEYVVDRHGDAMSMFYNKETNNYGRNNSTTATPYTRASYLDHIDYGQREVNGSLTAPSARVVFTAVDRCIPGATCAPDQPASWPDVPWDQACSATPCTDKHSPTFWSTKRLAKVTTQVSGQDVDSWTFNHVFPQAGDDGSPALWLASILHRGHVGGAAEVPEVRFVGVERANRVDSDEHRPPLTKWRVAAIGTETGGLIEVSYTQQECAVTALPVPDRNAEKCYPAYWTPQGELEPRLDYFNKFVVTQVKETDLVGGNPLKVTQYDYLDGTAWHRDDAEMTPARFKTYGQYRGFQKVRVRTGDPNAGKQTRTEHLFMRGMDDDLMSDGVTRRNAEIVDSKGGKLDDRPQWKGFARETVTYDGDTVVSSSLQEPISIGPNASRNRESGPLGSYVTEIRTVRERVALAAGGARETEVQQEYDEYGLPIRTTDLGDVSTPADDTCTRYSYARNTQDWIVDPVSRVEKLAASCAAAAYPADLLAEERSYYDNSTTLGAPPSAGDETRTEELSVKGSAGLEFTKTSETKYDAHGRVTESVNALGDKVTTAYTPASGGPLTQIVVTNPLGHATTSTVDVRGADTSTVDANGRRTDLAYDPLGRLTAVWKPGRAKSVGASANLQYEYLVRADGPSAVTTRELLGSGAYLTKHTLYDGFLRERQTQATAPGGGRVVSDVIHDSHGRIAKTNQPYWNSDAPATTLHAARDADVPGQVSLAYDGAGRKTAEILSSHGAEKWRTTTAYGGNWVSETPPAGDTPTTRILDAHGQVVELRQHFTGGHDTTKYTYTKLGQLDTATDPAGNVWRYHYDPRGREIQVDDPDKGTNLAGYDAEGRITSITDSRGKTLTFAYDALDRRTAVHEGTTKLAEWTFDTLPGGKGMPVAAIRWHDGQAYRNETLGYDEAGRPTGTAVTIPSTERGLGGRYETTFGYNIADQVVSAALPAAGGLRAETLRTTYDAVGLPSRLTGLTQYVGTSAYTALGEPQQFTLGVNGKQVYRTFSYDAATRRLIRTQTDRQTATQPVVTDTTLDYDPAGNITKIANGDDVQCFRTDHLRRTTEAWTATDGCTAAPSLSVLGGPAPYWLSYTYDATGNRTAERRRSSGVDVTRTYTYATPQPHAARSITEPGRTEVNTYDPAGNLTERTVNGVQRKHTWDVEGHLSTVVEGTQTTAFLYDADGNRLIRRDPSGTTLYLGDTELKADQSGVVVSATRYYSHNDEVVAVRSKAGTEKLNWLVSDHHGTAEVTVESADLAVGQRRFTPFGQPRGATPSWPDERGFVGGTADASTGLVHLGAREYDPANGRFLSVDPLIDHHDPQQVNGYAYGNNSPATYSDADGLKAKKTKTKAVKTKSAKKVKATVSKTLSSKSAAKKKKPKSSIAGGKANSGKGKAKAKGNDKPKAKMFAGLFQPAKDPFSKALLKSVSSAIQKAGKSGSSSGLADKKLAYMLAGMYGGEAYDYSDGGEIYTQFDYDWGYEDDTFAQEAPDEPDYTPPPPPYPGWSPTLPPGYSEPESSGPSMSTSMTMSTFSQPGTGAQQPAFTRPVHRHPYPPAPGRILAPGARIRV